jgi:V8-like Glu-specific endopeptidase
MTLIMQLNSAGSSFDWAQVHLLCQAYVADLQGGDDLPQLYEWKPVLSFLREHRRYDDLVAVADALLACGVNDALVGRSVAQSLVDRGAPATARLMFEQLAGQAVEGSFDWAEARGGIARCAKDLFLATRAPRRREDYLRRAYTLYRHVYDTDPGQNYWHGINAAAVAVRAARDGVAPAELGVEGPGEGIAEETRRLVERVVVKMQQLPPTPWIESTYLEACVALGRHGEALDRARALVQDPAVTAFALNALLRQLTQVWQLDVETPPGADLLPLLRAGLMQRTGGDVVLAPHELTRDRLVSSASSLTPEKVFGADRYVPLPWYRTGLLRCRAVARIEGPLNTPIGTGFLVTAAALGLDRPGTVILTNAHVVPDAVATEDASATFHALKDDGDDGAAFEFAVRQVLWSSDRSQLDTSVLVLDGAPHGVEPLTLAPRLPNLATHTPQRAYVIGHPQGWDEPQFSMQDNQILDYDNTYLHYRSPTDRGSSGSPVFDNHWRLIGLHHAGSEQTPRLNGKGGFYPANEATTIPAIKAALAVTPPSR